MLDEPSVFLQLNNGLDTTIDAAKKIALLRDDLRWNKIAELLQQMKSQCFQLRLQSMQKEMDVGERR